MGDWVSSDIPYLDLDTDLRLSWCCINIAFLAINLGLASGHAQTFHSLSVLALPALPLPSQVLDFDTYSVHFCVSKDAVLALQVRGCSSLTPCCLEFGKPTHAERGAK